MTNNVQTPGGNTTTAGAVEMARIVTALEPLVSDDMAEPFKSAWLADLASAALSAIFETAEAEDARIVRWLRSEYASACVSRTMPANAITMIETIARLIEEGAHRQ